LALEIGLANLEIFSQTLIALGRQNDKVLVVTSDSRGSGKLIPFAQALPEQLVEVGIAEQNLVGISAGLASTGKHVYAVSPACFLTARALEQIKNDVCYSDNPVKLIGISAGVSYGPLGSTHHSLHDLAALRALQNITIIVPADNFETQSATKAALDLPHPVYIRFGKRPMAHLHNNASRFEVGKPIKIKEGSDLAFLATGETVSHALMAAFDLEKQGIHASVNSVHTVKPLDQAAVLDAAESCGFVITVEEHSVHGGLGEACAGVLLQHGIPAKFKIVGIPDEYTVTGPQLDILRHYGISAQGLARTAMELLGRT
jgi:transketolase